MTHIRFALLAIMMLATPARAELLPPVAQSASIPSNFDVNAWLAPADVPGLEHGGGAFRFICNVAKLGKFDPIVYPGQKTAGHLHVFFGNTAVTESSTYESLRASGDSSCQGGPLNRSGYWMPALIREDGKVVIPQWIGIYYKGEPSNGPAPPGGFAITDHLPRGLRYVFGFDKDKPLDGSRHEWVCYHAGGNTTPKGTIKETLEDPVGCREGGSIEVRINSPNCWDGRLDSPNHRDHMAYGGYGGWGYYRCPDSHPRRLPQFTIKSTYAYDSVAEIATWYLSSDRMPGMVHASGSTFHSDWFGAWDDDVLKIWHDNCIEKSLNCSGFVLGNGQYGKQPATFTFDQQPRLVNPPADEVVVVVPPPVVVPPVKPRWLAYKHDTPGLFYLRDNGKLPTPVWYFTKSEWAIRAAGYLNKVAP